MEKKFNVSMEKMNSFGMKVKAACLVNYYSVDELDAISRMSDLPRPFFHIGEGSNLLFTQDFPGTILHSHIRFLQPFSSDRGMTVRLGAGVNWDEFCDWCAKRALWGPENLSMIPGEAGAACVQNIGAYGREIGELVSTVECYDMLEHKMTAFKKDDCTYGYRDSFFKKEGKGRYVVTAVSLCLRNDYSPSIEYGSLRQTLTEKCGRFAVYENRLTPEQVRKAIMEIRAEKLPDPAVVGCAGSFFKNPYVQRDVYQAIAENQEEAVPHFDLEDGRVKIPAAWLIEKCGWKGYTGGNVGVWEKQALVIVNLSGKASPEEILQLENKIKESVKAKFGIDLIPEVEHV